MGRYYYGDISGKFWFACQSSDDADYYVEIGEGYPILRYKVCNCIYDEAYSEYCSDCYDSYDEHYKAYKDDDFYDDDDDDDVKLYYDEAGEIRFDFYKDEIEYVENQLELIENKLGQEFLNKINFKMNKDDDYSYDLDYDIHSHKRYLSKNGFWNFDNEKDIEIDVDKYLARWCLGKQILQCLKDKGQCSFDCEL